MQKPLYKLAYLLTPFVFGVFFILNSQMCFFGCVGDNTEGFWYGLLAVSTYIIIIELLKILVSRFYLHQTIKWGTVLYTILIPLVVIAYTLGKLNGI